MRIQCDHDIERIEINIVTMIRRVSYRPLPEAPPRASGGDLDLHEHFNSK
jgi:hypothetical protein